MDTRTNCGYADGWSKPHPYSGAQKNTNLLSKVDKHISKYANWKILWGGPLWVCCGISLAIYVVIGYNVLEWWSWRV